MVDTQLDQNNFGIDRVQHALHESLIMERQIVGEKDGDHFPDIHQMQAAYAMTSQEFLQGEQGNLHAIESEQNQKRIVDQIS